MDVIIGVPFSDTAVPFRLNRGRVDVYSGSSYAAIFVEYGDGAGDNLGLSVAALADWGSSGKARVLAGAPNASNGAGLVREYDANGVLLADFTNASATGFGMIMTSCRDIDRDGYPDFAVGDQSQARQSSDQQRGKLLSSSSPTRTRACSVIVCERRRRRRRRERPGSATPTTRRIRSWSAESTSAPFRRARDPWRRLAGRARRATVSTFGEPALGFLSASTLMDRARGDDGDPFVGLSRANIAT